MSLRIQVTQPSDPSYRIIPLTQGQITLVDATDYEWLNQWKWCALWMENVRGFYAVRSGPRDANYKQERFAMARVIMDAQKGVVVDHEDHDTLNNRRYNLRVATYSQNGFNRRKHVPGSSGGFKGVSWNKLERKWRAHITINWKRTTLGQFRTKEEAIDAYKKAAIAAHGEFLYLKEDPGLLSSMQAETVLD